MRPLSTLAPALFAAVLLAAGDASAFAFLCNGIDASGSADGDGCGADCRASTAARWDELQVDFAFDDAVRPPEVSLAEWQQNQTAVVANWNNVQGQSLTVRDAGGAQARDFGVQNGENSIFWITNSNEFSQQVGGGINSILGVTLAPYSCGRAGSRRGGIEDADIVMNGVGFDWDENSVVSTLTHEMGHAIGFGHPCVDCSNLSIMSATSGFNDSDTPLLDDEDAIRSLYPGTPGGIGTACSVDGDCDDNTCVTVGISGTDRSFCSQSCASDATCTNGMICADVNGEGRVCVFSNAGTADIGEACGPPGCIDECEGVDIGPGCSVCSDTCVAGCTPSTGAGCGAGEACSEFLFSCQNNSDCNGATCSGGTCRFDIGGCFTAGTAGRGQACDENTACIGGLTCITDTAGNNGQCLALCSGAGAGCLNSENCLFVFGAAAGGTDPEQGVCLPAGDGSEVDSCNDFTDCGRGLLCTGQCEQRCDRGFTCLEDGQACATVSGGSLMATCDPVGGGPIAEGEGEGPVEGEGEDRECDPSRGNFDCAQGRSCDDGDCVLGEGPTGTFALCASASECSGGICDLGVCSRPCDFADGCPAGYSCDEDVGVTGGLCVAESCRDNDAICAEGFACAYSSAQRYVCAKGVTPPLCACSTTSESRSLPLPGLAAVLGLLGLALRRRRPALPG